MGAKSKMKLKKTVVLWFYAYLCGGTSMRIGIYKLCTREILYREFFNFINYMKM